MLGEASQHCAMAYIVRLPQPLKIKGRAVVAHAFNPSVGEAEAGKSLGFRPSRAPRRNSKTTNKHIQHENQSFVSARP